MRRSISGGTPFCKKPGYPFLPTHPWSSSAAAIPHEPQLSFLCKTSGYPERYGNSHTHFSLVFECNLLPLLRYMCLFSDLPRNPVNFLDTVADTANPGNIVQCSNCGIKIHVIILALQLLCNALRRLHPCFDKTYKSLSCFSSYSRFSSRSRFTTISLASACFLWNHHLASASGVFLIHP